MTKSKKNKKLRPLGEIILDIEPFLLEMADHDLQWPEYHGLLHTYLQVHLPDQNPEYMDGSNPIYFIGPKEKMLTTIKKLR